MEIGSFISGAGSMAPPPATSVGSAVEQYDVIYPPELASRLKLPLSWVVEHLRPSCLDRIPHVQFGRSRRIQWDGAPVQRWIEAHLVPRAYRSTGAGDYQVIDSAQLAGKLKLTESWIRDQVRQRCADPIPHLQFGMYVRFRWLAPELQDWLNRRMIIANNRAVGRVQ